MKVIIPKDFCSTYIRSENRVAGWRFLHRHRETEGAGAETAMLHERNPLQRATSTVISLNPKHTLEKHGSVHT